MIKAHTLYNDNNFSVVSCPEAYRIAKKHAKGSYQEDVIAGYEAMSGSTLKGKARREYSYKYAQSRKALLMRLEEDPRIVVSTETGKGGRQVLVIELPEHHERRTSGDFGTLAGAVEL